MTVFTDFEIVIDKIIAEVRDARSQIMGEERRTAPSQAPPQADAHFSSIGKTVYATHAGKKRHGWTKEQTEMLVELRCQGVPFRVIGQHIGKSGQQCLDRMKVLKRK